MDIFTKIQVELVFKGLNWSKLAEMAGYRQSNFRKQLNDRIFKVNQMLKPAGIELDIKKISDEKN